MDHVGRVDHGFVDDPLDNLSTGNKLEFDGINRINKITKVFFFNPVHPVNPVKIFFYHSFVNFASLSNSHFLYSLLSLTLE